MMLHEIPREITIVIPEYAFGVNRDGTGWCYNCQTLGWEGQTLSHEISCAAQKLQIAMDLIFYCECVECREFAAYHMAKLRYDDEGNVISWLCVPCEDGRHVTI